MVFRPEPVFAHGTAAQTGVLLCNLGTPAEPTAPAVRAYLREFLSDPRVVELPAALWQPVLHGLVLRRRPAQSAAKYAQIWTSEGSPLLAWSQKQAKLLRGWLGAHGHQVLVEPAMRYGAPSIAKGIDTLRAQGVTRVLVLPLYPQYSGTTTASIVDSVFAWARTARRVPEWRFVNHFYRHPLYINALAEQVRSHWQRHGRGQKLVMSFHGVPVRTLERGDPYHCECQVTARLLAERLGLAPDESVVSFQSRFGKAKWLEPSTSRTLAQLARNGITHVDVICPGFVTDCLETLEEIAIEGRQTFLDAGGRQFGYVACLNDRPAWIEALGRIALQHLGGWPTEPLPPSERAVQEQALRASARRARERGARQ